MTKLKLGPLADDRPIKLTIELPAAVHRDLQAYAAALAAEGGMAVRKALVESLKNVTFEIAPFERADDDKVRKASHNY